MSSDFHENINVKKLKQNARKRIINYSFTEDQTNTLNRWIDTFLYSCDLQHTKEHQDACLIIKLTLAAIAHGDFRLRFFSNEEEFKKPPITFQITDYISHAGRVLIDLSKLSREHHHKVLSIFDINKMKPRPSTHCILSYNGKYSEAKSQTHGGIETFKGFVHKAGEATGINQIVQGTPLQGPVLTDYGINIQMGGFGQLNLSRGWSQFGLDGHILLHCATDSKAVLIGLEQSSPFVKPLIVDIPIEENNSVGLSGFHSITGASDDYTAAGSLYFSNLIYKLKVFLETNCWCPTKYDGMSIKIDNDNIDAIWNYFNLLKETDSKEKLFSLLSIKPKNAINIFFSATEILENISDKDIDDFFKQLISVEILTPEAKELKNQFKFKIHQIRQFSSYQEVDFDSLNLNQEIYENQHLNHLNRLINNSLFQMHEKIVAHIKDIFKETTPDLYRAQFIIDSFKKFVDASQTNSKLYHDLNSSYQNYLKISQELKIYLQIVENKLSAGFILYRSLMKARESLRTHIDSDDAQVIYNSIYEHLRMEEKFLLNSVEHRSVLENLQQENERLLMRVSDFESYTLNSKKDLEQQDKYLGTNEIYIFNLSEVIFNLNTIGLVSAVCCIALLTTIFLGYWSFSNELTCVALFAGISLYSFFTQNNSRYSDDISMHQYHIR